ncbi:MAG: NAD(P) transhydrogenase subunit alpha [Flavobacteriales bacterium]
MIIGILKEQAHRRLVTLTPVGVKRLGDQARVVVQRGAGTLAGFPDESYRAAGARVLNGSDAILEEADIILSHDSLYEGGVLPGHRTFVGFHDVLGQPAVVSTYERAGIDLFSLSLMPRTTLAQSMDVQSSVASIGGYQAVLLAAERSLATVPMISGAGGTLRPARFLVMGAGVGGLQAIATARRLGAQVKAYDVRSAAKEEVESLGAEFIQVDGAIEDRKAGGYAVEQSAEHLDRLRVAIQQEAAQADVIITTARVPGRRAPILITRAMVEAMKPGAVIVDMAASSGGNCELTDPDHTVMAGEITILGPRSIECGSAHSTSILISNNYTAFLLHLLAEQCDRNDDSILKATQVVANGKVVNERFLTLASAAF